MSSTIRTRFAPSPTGYLHIGSVRTALYAWLFARHHNGQFILRIEDTDRERSTKESIDAILEGMKWLGLDYDEGPYYQTQHFARYREVVTQLLETGHAYRCTCSQERLIELRNTQIKNKEKPRYDGHCRDLNHDDSAPHVIRFRTPLEGDVAFKDGSRGSITVSNQELDDLIIARTDGTPTYNLTATVDDMDMKITHVIRGDDHINNTPRQINILKALNAPLPEYAHIPMILGPDGKRLSKRHGAVSVLSYREEGYLPEALLNYLVRLGWSHGDQEVFSREEMIRAFGLEHISHSPAAINPEKLQWLNQHYIKTSDTDTLSKQLKKQYELIGVNTDEGPALTEIVTVMQERAKTLSEMAEKSRCFYDTFTTYDNEAANKHLTKDSLKPLKCVTEKLEALKTWEKEAIHDVIKDAMTTLDIKMGKIAQPIRVAVTGNTESPSIDVTLYLLGKDRVITSLKKAIAFVQ